MPKVVDFRKTDLIITKASESFIVCYNCNVFTVYVCRTLREKNMLRLVVTERRASKNSMERITEI